MRALILGVMFSVIASQVSAQQQPCSSPDFITKLLQEEHGEMKVADATANNYPVSLWLDLKDGSWSLTVDIGGQKCIASGGSNWKFITNPKMEGDPT